MGLISKEVYAGLNGTSIKHFESLGYEIPRRKTDKYGKMSVPMFAKIKVKVEDLQEGSTVQVDVECDYCKKNLHMTYATYKKFNHNGKYYCRSCAGKLFHCGENNGNYNYNKTDEERIIDRKYPEYNKFIKKVLARDNYICKCCGRTPSGDLEVHHLDGYNWCVEKRTDETNGITLCSTCHANFHMKYGRGYNTKEQFEEWIGYTIGELEKYNGKLPTTLKVYCIEDEILYDSMKDIEFKYGIAAANIHSVCSHKYTQINGKHFLFEYEYLSKSKEELEQIKNTFGRDVFNKKVICITAGIIFNKIKDAEKHYGINNVGLCCSGKRNYAGKLPDGTPLKWMYYEDFLKLSIEEQNEILSRNKDPESSNDGSFLLDKEAM